MQSCSTGVPVYMLSHCVAVHGDQYINTLKGKGKVYAGVCGLWEALDEPMASQP